jgi:hypothetical protein
MSFHLFFYGTDGRTYTRAKGRDAKLLLMPSCFAKGKDIYNAIILLNHYHPL